MPESPESFKVGDVVQLKSGGPLMTVTGESEYSSKRYADCAYFVDNDRLAKVELPFEALIIPETHKQPA